MAVRKIRTLGFILCLVLVLLPLCSDAAGYSYNLTDIIPESAQQNAIKMFLDEETGIFTSTSRSYADIFDAYLKLYGIYAPESARNNANVVWAQDILLQDENRVTYIPDRYVADGELSEWVQRYAEPGDLLLYKASGIADKCVVYAGNGKIVGKYRDEIRLLDIRATYVTGEVYRTKSGGLFAIARMWSKEPEVETKRLNVVISTDIESKSFTGDQYELYLQNPDDMMYVKTNKYVVFEYAPGEYRIWDGEAYGLPVEYVKKCNGIYIQMALTAENSGQMIRRIKIAVPWEEIETDTDTYVFHAKTIDTGNLLQWNGNDLLMSIRSEEEPTP